MFKYMDKEKPTYEFSADKNRLLIEERGISFEEVIAALDNGDLLDIVAHHNREKYPNQEIYIVNIDGYIYLVPYVQKSEGIVFLKTIFPSRKLTKKYLMQVGE
jgi:uncharacterized DUF497 family protein